MQPPFDCSNGERQKTGNVGDGPILDVVQPQHRLVIRGQRGQGIEDALVLHAPRELVGGVSRTGRGQFAAVGKEKAVQFGRLRSLFALSPLADPPGAVPGDGAQPAAEPGRLGKLGQRLEREQESVLCYVLGPVTCARSQRLRRNERHGPAEAPHQRVEGSKVAEQGREHERLLADSRRACGGAVVVVHRRFRSLLPDRDGGWAAG